MHSNIYLQDIVLAKRKRLDKKRPSFFDAMKKEGLSIIGEIKRASPSKGIIRQDFNLDSLINAYKDSVDAISVLTEEDYFLGSNVYLSEVSKQVEIPTLCKDFIIDERQIYCAKALGASCILLIVNILTDRQLGGFVNLAKDLSMDTLVEVHAKEEIDRAMKAGAKIIGINNRNLKTFKTDIQTTLKLRKYVPKRYVVISESGIKTEDDIKALKDAAIDGILVGESFMRSSEISSKVEAFKNAYNS